jgi:rare lipoprotein A (peptidoglycan hydrolase)
LRILDLSTNAIKNVGYIKEGIMCNIALEKIDISSNMIGDSGMGEMAQAMGCNRGIETIAIGFNKYGI